jgi:hypothetical protein
MGFLYRMLEKVIFIPIYSGSCISLISGIYKILDVKYCVSTKNLNMKDRDCFVVPLIVMTISQIIDNRHQTSDIRHQPEREEEK